MKKERAITLISLIITIIILIILAGVGLNLSLGKNGILIRAKSAVEETKMAQIQEKIQLAVTDIVTQYLSKQEILTNYILKEELEKYTSLDGIVVNIDLTGSYQDYDYYIDEQYNVHLGNLIKDIPFNVDISLKEEKRKIMVSVTDAVEGIQKIELISPSGKIIATQNLDGIVTSEKLNAIANLSGMYQAKITSKSGKVATKKIEVAKIQIHNKAELEEFGEMVNDGVTFEGDTVTLLSDIYLEGNIDNRNWNSIGNSQKNNYFSGTFEGKNHKIYDMYNTETNEPQKGFFGYVLGGTIQNLGIESGNIKGDYRCGGIVGMIENGDIIHCYNKAKVEGGNIDENTGGIGGIAGYSSNSNIQECYNTGKIEGYYDSTGGITGFLYRETKILNCYNIGEINGYRAVGGIIGYMMSQGQNTMNNCYNKGNITANSMSVGGLVGIVRPENLVENSYSIGEISIIENAGGVIGENYGILSNLFFIKTAGPTFGCGFNNTEYALEEPNGSTIDTLKGLTNKLNGTQKDIPWVEDENKQNEEYPILSWQKP